MRPDKYQEARFSIEFLDRKGRSIAGTFTPNLQASERADVRAMLANEEQQAYRVIIRGKFHNVTEKTTNYV